MTQQLQTLIMSLIARNECHLWFIESYLVIERSTLICLAYYPDYAPPITTFEKNFILLLLSCSDFITKDKDHPCFLLCNTLQYVCK